MEIQKTANEQQRAFVIGKVISQKERVYGDANEALISPVAHKLFGFPWVAAVAVSPASVLITKQDWVSWDILEGPLSDLLQEHFSQYEGEIEENPEPKVQKTNFGEMTGPVVQVIQTLIEEQINPALANHGGFVVLHGVKESEVFLEMGGGCQGCAMSYQTLKDGIEEAIRSAVPQIQTVTDVTRHDLGENPYY